MVDTDLDYSDPAVENTQITPVRVLRKHKDPPPAQVTAHKSSRKASNENKSVRLPTNVDKINGMVQDITKQLHGQDINGNLSLHVIRAALCIQRAYLEKKKKAGKNTEHVVPAAGVPDQVCSMHGISTRN
jgi:hypothetical protein